MSRLNDPASDFAALILTVGGFTLLLLGIFAEPWPVTIISLPALMILVWIFRRRLVRWIPELDFGSEGESSDTDGAASLIYWFATWSLLFALLDIWPGWRLYPALNVLMAVMCYLLGLWSMFGGYSPKRMVLHSRSMFFSLEQRPTLADSAAVSHTAALVLLAAYTLVSSRELFVALPLGATLVGMLAIFRVLILVWKYGYVCVPSALLPFGVVWAMWGAPFGEDWTLELFRYSLRKLLIVAVAAGSFAAIWHIVDLRRYFKRQARTS